MTLFADTDVTAFSIEVNASQPVFNGHFPGQPILPGVFLLNFIRQQLQAMHDKPLHFSRLRRVKFLRPVVPDSRLRIECQCVQAPWYNCRVLAEDGAVLAQAEIEFDVVAQDKAS